MNQSILQKLQRVRLQDLGHIVLFLLALPLSLIYRRSHPDFWLICDNEREARDNGYWLFYYIRKNHPEQPVVYAIDKKSQDYNRVKDLGKVIQYGSLYHWICYLAASKNISSQKGGKPNAAVCHVLEVSGLLKNTRVFLQHGITKDDMEFLYYKNTRMRMFMCATQIEYDYVKGRFGYPEGWVQCPGFCRFDNLYDTSEDKKMILVMPTWRNWISKPTSKSYAIENIDCFSNTEYFYAWNSFLHDERLFCLLEKNGYHLVFYPHRDMQKFISDFHIESPYITVASWPEFDVQQLLKDASMLVTDYSSIAMDFAYMKKPLFYYQFDYEMFRKGQYAEGYFSYKEDGFGPVCESLDSLFYELENCFSQQLKISDVYNIRSDRFFSLRDTNNCERNFECIRMIDENRIKSKKKQGK